MRPRDGPIGRIAAPTPTRPFSVGAISSYAAESPRVVNNDRFVALGNYLAKQEWRSRTRRTLGTFLPSRSWNSRAGRSHAHRRRGGPIADNEAVAFQSASPPCPGPTQLRSPHGQIGVLMKSRLWQTQPSLLCATFVPTSRPCSRPNLKGRRSRPTWCLVEKSPAREHLPPVPRGQSCQHHHREDSSRWQVTNLEWPRNVLLEQPLATRPSTKERRPVAAGGESSTGQGGPLTSRVDELIVQCQAHRFSTGGLSYDYPPQRSNDGSHHQRR